MPGARRPPAAAAPAAGDDRPLHPAARARAAARSPSPAASSAAWTRSSPTPSTAPRRLRDEVGLDPGRVHVIPHGAFDYLTRLPEEKPLPAELEGAEGPVILFFGLLRPYKGIDMLLEAFRRVEGAELWIVGNPRMDVEPLRRARRRGAGPRPLRHPLRRGRRDPGDLPPRRPRRPALPRRRALRRPLHRPRLRQAAGAERGRRLPRGGADRRRAARPARGPRRARRRPRRAGRRRGRAASELAAAARAAAAGPYSWDAVAAPDPRPLPRAAARRAR